MSGYGLGSLRSRQGSVAIEYAFVLPGLMLFMLGAMDTGRLLWSYATLNRATEAAARCASVNPTICGTSTKIKAYAVTQAFGLIIPTTAFTPSTVVCGSRVVAAYSFRFIIPWLGVSPYGQSNSITLNATACYPAAH
jgi:Flp pilus assembly protein TadG